MSISSHARLERIDYAPKNEKIDLDFSCGASTSPNLHAGLKPLVYAHIFWQNFGSHETQLWSFTLYVIRQLADHIVKIACRSNFVFQNHICSRHAFQLYN